MAKTSTALKDALGGAAWVAEGQGLPAGLAVLDSTDCSLDLSDTLGTDKASGA